MDGTFCIAIRMCIYMHNKAVYVCGIIYRLLSDLWYFNIFDCSEPNPHIQTTTTQSQNRAERLRHFYVSFVAFVHIHYQHIALFCFQENVFFSSIHDTRAEQKKRRRFHKMRPKIYVSRAPYHQQKKNFTCTHLSFVGKKSAARKGWLQTILHFYLYWNVCIENE